MNLMIRKKEEPAALADKIKQVYYQEYKTAYDNDDEIDPDDPKFDPII
jgi:hypothetical protein